MRRALFALGVIASFPAGTTAGTVISSQWELQGNISSNATLSLDADILLVDGNFSGVTQPTGVFVKDSIVSLFIQGNDHVLDGRGSVRCMLVCGTEITLLRIVIAHGYGDDSNAVLGSGLKIDGSHGKPSSVHLLLSTIRDCSNDYCDGAIYAHSAVVTMEGTSVISNHGCGGIFIDQGQVTMTNCVVARNSAYGDGGGVSMKSSTAVIFNCSFADNDGAMGDGGWGGGIFLDSSQLKAEKSAFVRNKASIGGGVYITGDTSTSALFRGCSFSQNAALEPLGIPGLEGKGGGLAILNYASVSLDECHVEANNATEGGGVYVNVGAADDDAVLARTPGVWLTAVTVLNNLAAGPGGGGIFIKSGNINATRSFISENRAVSPTFSLRSPDTSDCAVVGGCIKSHFVRSKEKCSANITGAGTIAPKGFGSSKTSLNLPIYFTKVVMIKNSFPCLSIQGTHFVGIRRRPLVPTIVVSKYALMSSRLVPAYTLLRDP